VAGQRLVPIGDFAIGAEGGTQAVEEIRGGNEEGGVPLANTLISDSRRQVGLTATAGTG